MQITSCRKGHRVPFTKASDTFGPNSRVVRFGLVDQRFWEPASSRIQFTLHNKDSPNAVVPIARPLAMFSTILVLVSGIQMENWDYVGERTVLMDRLKGSARRQNDSAEHHMLTSGTGDAYQSVAASVARKAIFQPPFGTTMMDK